MTAIIIPSITQLTIAGVLAFVGLLVVVTYLLSKGKPKPIYIQLSTKEVIVLVGVNNLISEMITDGDLVMPKEKLEELSIAISKFNHQSYLELTNRHDELVMLMENKEINAANFLRL